MARPLGTRMDDLGGPRWPQMYNFRRFLQILVISQKDQRSE